MVTETTTNKKWGKQDDAKLANLFRRKKVNPAKLDKETIKKVWTQYFPERRYENFAPLFRRKCRGWSIEQTLRGGRKEGKY